MVANPYGLTREGGAISRVERTKLLCDISLDLTHRETTLVLRMVRVFIGKTPEMSGHFTQNGLKRRATTKDVSISPPPTKRKQISTTTRKLFQPSMISSATHADICAQENAVVSFFTPASKKEPEKIIWRVINDSLLIARYNAKGTNKADILEKGHRIAGFDLVRIANISASSSITSLIQARSRTLRLLDRHQGTNSGRTLQIGSGGMMSYHLR
jgi:hypothetical protein